MFGLKTAQRVIDSALAELEDMRAPIDPVRPEHMPRRHWGQDDNQPADGDRP